MALFKSILLAIFLLLSCSSHGATVEEVNADEQCKESLTSALTTFSSEKNKEMLEKCGNISLANDGMFVVLSMIVGENIKPIISVYSSLTGAPKPSISNEIINVLSDVHGVFYSINIVFLFITIFFVIIKLSFVALNLMSPDKKVNLKGVAKSEGVNIPLSVFMSYPVLGWMTPLQVVGVLMFILAVALSKYSITPLFVGFTTINKMEGVAEAVTPNYIGKTSDIVGLYVCDTYNRDKITNAVVAFYGKNKAEVEKSSTLNCLSQTNNVVETSVDAPDRLYIVPATLSQTKYCIKSNHSELLSMGVESNTLLDCGGIYVNKRIDGVTDVDAGEMWSKIKPLIFSNEAEHAMREIALNYRKLTCGVKHNNVLGDGCYQWTQNGTGYNVEYTVDELSDTKEIKVIDHMQESELNAITRDITELKRLVALSVADQDSFNSLLSYMISMTQKSENGENALVDKIFKTLKSGIASSASLFFGDSAGSKSEILFTESMIKLFDVDTEKDFNIVLDYLATYDYLTPNTSEKSILDKVGILPSLDIYANGFACWKEQAYCDVSPINPFAYMQKKGIELLQSSFWRYAVTALFSKMYSAVLDYNESEQNKKINKNKKLFVLDSVSDILAIYFILGLILAFIIPLMCAIKIMSLLITYTIDLVKELFYAQFVISTSPTSSTRESGLHISQEIGEIKSAFFGLSLRLFFITLSIVVLFVMVSFMFGINVFVVNYLSDIMQWDLNAPVFSAVIYKVVIDVIIVMIFTYQVYKSLSYMDTFINLSLEKFNIDSVGDDSMLDRVVNVIRHRVPMNIASLMHK
jgi:hypothetical protein